MKPAPNRPRVHLFVCTNTRDDSPLGPGCGARGAAVLNELKAVIVRRRLATDAWITRSGCLGVCPSKGAAVACYPSSEPIRTEVEPADAQGLLASILP